MVLHASEFILSDESLDLGLVQVASRVIFIYLTAEQLQNGLTSADLIRNEIKLIVNLNESLPMLIDKLHNLLTRPFLYSLDPQQILLQRNEVHLWFLLTTLLVELLFLAQRLQVQREIEILSLELCRHHYYKYTITQSKNTVLLTLIIGQL